MKKILIVEDEESIRIALEDDFRLENYDVEVASDGIEGLAKARFCDFELKQSGKSYTSIATIENI